MFLIFPAIYLLLKAFYCYLDCFFLTTATLTTAILTILASKSPGQQPLGPWDSILSWLLCYFDASWLVTAGTTKESAFSTTTHSSLSSLSKIGQQPLGQTKYPVFTLVSLLNCLAGDSCAYWGNLISGEVLASDCWDHQTRVCHIPH